MTCFVDNSLETSNLYQNNDLVVISTVTLNQGRCHYNVVHTWCNNGRGTKQQMTLVFPWHFAAPSGLNISQRMVYTQSWYCSSS